MAHDHRVAATLVARSFQIAFNSAAANPYPAPAMRLLIVEDTPQLARALAEGLKKSGIVADLVGDGLHADQLLQSERFDAVLLDLTLPRLDGLEVLRRLRARGDDVPVLVLTARGSTLDRVQGLNEGADDYLAKPFELAEVEARIKALVRRRHGRPAPVLQLGPLRYDTVSRRYQLGEAPLEVTPREHAVLEALLLKAGQPVAKQALCDRLCNLDDAVTPDAVEIYVHRLRKKLAGTALSIRTLRGLGYLLEAGSGDA